VGQGPTDRLSGDGAAYGGGIDCPDMRIEGHYDASADIASVHVEGYDPATAVGEESDSGLRELDPVTGEVVGLEFWRASEHLPAEFLRMLPPPQVEIAA
jgi:uncharacterized protein YuzE